ncbi:hypothetical protein BC834DRAFT_912000, partial [Gloeopeniophorella convolvens]
MEVAHDNERLQHMASAHACFTTAFELGASLQGWLPCSRHAEHVAVAVTIGPAQPSLHHAYDSRGSRQYTARSPTSWKVQSLSAFTLGHSNSNDIMMAIAGQYPSLETLDLTSLGGTTLPHTFVAPELRSLLLHHVTIPIDSPLFALPYLQSLQLIHLSPRSDPDFTPNNLAAQLSKMHRLHKLGISFSLFPTDLYRSH